MRSIRSPRYFSTDCSGPCSLTAAGCNDAVRSPVLGPCNGIHDPRRYQEYLEMGGTRGEVRGNSKIEAYLEYSELVDGYGDLFQTHIPDPKNKKLCKRLMDQDPETGEWVLRYRLHT